MLYKTLRFENPEDNLARYELIVELKGGNYITTWFNPLEYKSFDCFRISPALSFGEMITLDLQELTRYEVTFLKNLNPQLST